MEILIHNGNRLEPSIVLNKEKGIFSFKGRSIVNNPLEFYEPVKKWAEEYCKVPNEKTKLIIEFDYFNSSSFKALVDLFKVFSVLKNNGLQVVWYAIDDDDIIEEAQKIMEIADLEFDFIYLEE